MKGLGNDLVFEGYLLATGREPCIYRNVNAIPVPVCPEENRLLAAGASALVDEILILYPNPFAESFTMKVSGKEGEIATVAVYSGTGMPVEELENIQVNIHYPNVGRDWQKVLLNRKNSQGTTDSNLSCD